MGVIRRRANFTHWGAYVSYLNQVGFFALYFKGVRAGRPYDILQMAGFILIPIFIDPLLLLVCPNHALY